MYYGIFCSRHVAKTCYPILFCQCSHLCFTQSFAGLSCCAAVLTSEIWGSACQCLPQGRAVTFNSISQKDKVSPAVPSIFRQSIAEVSVACGCGDYYSVTPASWDTRHFVLPTVALTCHALVPGSGINMCRLNPSRPPSSTCEHYTCSKFESSVKYCGRAAAARWSYATKSVSADLHGTCEVRGTRPHLSLKDTGSGKTDIFPIEGYCH